MHLVVTRVLEHEKGVALAFQFHLSLFENHDQYFHRWRYENALPVVRDTHKETVSFPLTDIQSNTASSTTMKALFILKDSEKSISNRIT